MSIAKAISPIRHDSFNILKSDDLVIGGYASIEMVDKQNDLITINALKDAVTKYMDIPKFRNVMSNHSNVQVGEVIPKYRDKGGKLWKTGVDDVGFFVVIKMREDIEKAKEVNRDIRSGSLRSFSIGGQAIEKRKRSHKEYGDYNEISQLELHEVTICEKGINPEAKFDVLKQDKGDNMNEIEKALDELNKTLDKINNGPEDTLNKESIENDINNIEKENELVAETNNMSDLEKEEEELEMLDTDEPEIEMDEDTEMKSKPDLVTGKVEAGNAGDLVTDSHDQLDSNYMAKFEEQSTLNLSPENLEKSYREFKADELEKLALSKVKDTFQARFDNEMLTKTEEIEKANYDAQAEVSELKKQFSDLLSSLTDEKETTIRKQEEAIAEFGIPSQEEISKMDWNQVNALMEKLESGL